MSKDWSNFKHGKVQVWSLTSVTLKEFRQTKRKSGMPPPEDKKGIESLLGVTNYVAEFIPDMPTVDTPNKRTVEKGRSI